MVDVVLNIRGRGIACLIVEHVLEGIMPIADKIVVLDRGEKIADGTTGRGVARSRPSSPPTWETRDERRRLSSEAPILEVSQLRSATTACSRCRT
jgi:ABC-type sugar transport system ATPase subunit